MKRILAWAVASAAATAIAGTASAADIRPAPPPAVKAPAYAVPLLTWTGFYLGGNLGYGWNDTTGTITVGPFRGRTSGDADGILGGVQLGYNWQMGALVAGFETDFQASAVEGTFRGRLAPGIPLSGTVETPWFGTIRGRLGYAVDRWLVYVTGGGAYSENKARGNVGGIPFSSSATGWSWTVGGGVETKFTHNWSIKGEYLYISTPDKLPVPTGARLSADTDSHVIRLGVNYHF